MTELRQTIYREVLIHDPSRMHFAIALRSTSAIAVIVLIGVLMQQTQAAAILCGGALTVGSGVYQRIGRSQIAPMMLATVGMGVSAAAGTLAGLSPAVLVAAAALWGFIAGLLPVLGGSGQWVGQQCAIALMVAGSYPGTLDHALSRAGLVMAGGVMQIATTEWLLRFRDIDMELNGWPKTRREAIAAWHTVRDAVLGQSAELRFAWRVAVVLAVAVTVERRLALPNGYWVGMTTILLLRPQFHDTWHRGASRVLGTLAGAAVVMLAAGAGAPSWVFPVGVVVTAYFCFAIQQFSYSLFAFCLTAYIVLLLAFAGAPEQLVAHNRIIGTILGAGFALAGHLHFLAGRARLQPDRQPAR